MKITLKTTVRTILDHPSALSALNEVSRGLFDNPAIKQADSMPLERIAGFLPGDGISVMRGIIDRANAMLDDADGSDDFDRVQDEIDRSVGLEASETEKDTGTRSSIKPGKPWTDTDGNRIQAHGGTMFIEGDRYYWIGENKDHTMGTGTIWTWGIKIYSSTHLYNWEDEGYLVPPELKDKNSLFYPTCRLDRPHLIYNERTKKYVLWIKFIDEAHFSVLVSDKLMGEYRVVKRELRPFGANCGDFDLATDQKTGQGYLYFEANHKDVWAVRLSDDYTDVIGEKEIIYENVPLPYTREGLAHVFRNGKHYLFSSGMTGYIPNPSEVAVSDDWTRGYRVLGNPHKNDDSSASFNSQISCVFKVAGQDRYVVMADRWVPDFVVTKEIYERIVRVIEARKNPSLPVSEDDKTFFAGLPMIGSAKTALADYVWLPVSFDGDCPQIEWKDEWRISD
ncbi:MAG: family 43 glycosylhydrolase [Clostridiales bacterium]|nr:family 43 glycosylhydrolase [Clostridiales bacterium]